MAETKVELKLKWENNSFFELTAKEDGGDPITIIEMQENSCIEKLWKHAQGLVLAYVAQLVTRIGNEMKEE